MIDIDNDDKVVLKPTDWYDTPGAAYEGAHEHFQDLQMELHKFAIKNGYNGMAISEPRPDDFTEEKAGKNAPKAQPKHAAPSETKELMKKLLSIDQQCKLFNIDIKKVVDPFSPENKASLN